MNDDDLQSKVDEAAAEAEAGEQAATTQMGDESGLDENALLKEQLARAMADMQNMKRRMEEDRVRMARFANLDLLRSLLPILDNFDRSTQHLPEALAEDAWAKGVVATHDELMKWLTSVGVEKIATVGEKLDPTKHEAVMQDAGEKDVILEEFEPGYTYNDEVIKPAKVKVGNGQ